MLFSQTAWYKLANYANCQKTGKLQTVQINSNYANIANWKTIQNGKLCKLEN